MKTARTRAVAPMPRPSMHAPLSDPRLRFMTAGPDGGEGTAGSSAESQVDDSGDSGQPSASDASDDAGSEQVDDEQGERPSQADDPKLRAARDEAYQNRVKAREAKAAADTAAQEKDALIQSIGKALGLIKDNDDAAPDADALTAQVAEAQARAAESARELAVYKAAASANADPDKLLDSRSFLASIAEVDPTDSAAVKKAVEDAVKANQSFALGRVSSASSADTASGPGGGSAPKASQSIHDAVAAHYAN